MSPEQRRARRISAANRPENVPRPDFKSRTTFGAKLFKNFQKLSKTFKLRNKGRTTFDCSA